jgi:hypothetical protein
MYYALPPHPQNAFMVWCLGMESVCNFTIPPHFSNTDVTSEPDSLQIFQLYITFYFSYLSLDLAWRKIYYLLNLPIHSLNRRKNSNIHKTYTKTAFSFGVNKKH